MSSRLFQSIREERGLAYSIYSELNPFRDTGSLAVYAGCAHRQDAQVLELTLAEFARLKTRACHRRRARPRQEPAQGQHGAGPGKLRSRMSSLARQQLYFSRFFTVDEIADEVSAVTAEEIQQLAQQLLDPRRLALTLLGPLNGLKIERSDSAC